MGGNAIAVEEAVESLLSYVNKPSDYEELPLLGGLGRTIRGDVCARINQPPFDRSPLDGYAVIHSDLIGASKQKPARLRVTQYICAGDVPHSTLKPGEAARIMTGAPLPAGATCVVRQEVTDGGNDVVGIYQTQSEYENYCFSGEDIAVGQPLIRDGDRLDCVRMGVLAGQGFAQVKVYPKPKVSLFSTGNEVSPIGGPLEPGKIYDSNCCLLSLRSVEIGADVVAMDCLPDDPETLASALQKALCCSDLVITTGGVSVGAHDHMPLVGEMLGAHRLFHGIAAKPGSPALALEKDGKLVLCLSGNPFAAFATFELLAAPVIRKLSGRSIVMGKRLTGTLMECFNKPSLGRRFLRARLEAGSVYLPGGRHASGMLCSLVDCNCLVDIPAGSGGLTAGDPVEVIML